MNRAARLRLLHRVLTPGAWVGAPTDAARLRGWARLLEWREAPTARQRFYLIRRALKTAPRAWREAGEEVAKFGAEVEAVSGVSPQTQRRQLWWLAVRHGINAQSYLDYQLYRPERHRRAAAYLQTAEAFRVGRWVNRQMARPGGYPVDDKLRLFEWCRTNGLPAIPTLLEYEHGTLVVSTLTGEPTESLPSCDLFSKPSDATGGHGTERWRHVSASDRSAQDGVRGWIARNGQVRSASELLAELAHISRTLPPKHGTKSRRILLQPCVRNHRDLLPLTPGGLCTVRVITYRALGEAACVLLAVYKMPTGDTPADNFHFGGVIAPVDVTTGRLGPAIRRQGRILVPIERHPDTGTIISGHQLPCWPETLALATRALDAAYDRPTIGWDIAITDNGPILVEGNGVWDAGLAQEPSGIPLSDTLFPGVIDTYVRAYLRV